MTGQKQHEVIEALVTLWETATDVTMPVYDGPNGDIDTLDEAIFVGWDPADSDSQVGTLTQEYVAIGGRSKEENGTVAVVVWAASGDRTTRPRRQRIATELDAMEAAVRKDPSLSETVLDSNFASAQRLHQMLHDGGNDVFAVVTFDYRARV